MTDGVTTNNRDLPLPRVRKETTKLMAQFWQKQEQGGNIFSSQNIDVNDEAC